LVPAQRQQVLVAGYDNLGTERDGGCDDVVVVRIAADRANVGRRTGKLPADLFQFRAPPNDRRLAMAVNVSQAGREKCIAGFIKERRR
jgi:hypothetical protein